MISVCYVDACCHWLGGRCPHFPKIAYKHCLSCAHIQDTPRNPKLIIGINSGINGWQRWMDGWRLQIAYWKPSPNSLTCTRQHMGSLSVFCVCVCVCVWCYPTEISGSVRWDMPLSYYCALSTSHTPLVTDSVSWAKTYSVLVLAIKLYSSSLFLLGSLLLSLSSFSLTFFFANPFSASVIFFLLHFFILFCHSQHLHSY